MEPVYFSPEEVETAYEALLAGKQVAGDDDTYGALEERDSALAKFLRCDRDTEDGDLILIWLDEAWKEELEVYEEDEEWEDVEDEDIDEEEDLNDEWDDGDDFYLDDPEEED